MDLATVLDQMNAVLCVVYKGENKMNVYKHEGVFSWHRGENHGILKLKKDV